MTAAEKIDLPQTAEEREKRLAESLGRILKTLARTIVIKNHDADPSKDITDIFKEINETEIIPDDELEVLEAGKNKLHAEKFCHIYGIPPEEMNGVMESIGLKKPS